MTLSTSLARPIIPALALMLSGCAGVGTYMHDTLVPGAQANAAASESVNMQRATGNEVAVEPLTPAQGDVWPGPLQPVPTLSQIQKNMNVPLSEEYNRRYGAPDSPIPAPGQPAYLAQPRIGSEVANPSPGPTPPSLPAPPSFGVGQTLMGPYGPVGIVTTNSNGRYQTVAPINGQGGGTLTPNGNGTATLISPGGEATTVLAPAR